MKDGFKTITIEPFNGYLDFQGPINPQKPSGNLSLKGDIRMELTKSVKVKNATIKFKGSSRVCHQNTLDIIDVSTPILPKLKTQLFNSTTSLGPGKVTLPWELEILNIYPCSVMIKRVSIHYKIELTISFGLHRTVTAEYPIVIRRHLLPCLEVTPLVPTKLYTKTISTKFHYEINAPRIVCIAQEAIPVAIKLLTIGSQKRVLSVRTQIIQVELYRCNSLPKADADMTNFKTQLLNQKSATSSSSSISSGKKGEANKYAKYTKRTNPAIIHTLDETQLMTSSQPLLIRHPLGEYLTLGFESPLAAIYHQLEITFQFGARFEDIRAKIPILVASAPPSIKQTTTITSATSTTTTTGKQTQQTDSLPLALYPYEKLPVWEPICVTDENRLGRNRSANKTPTPSTNSSSDAADEEDEEEVGGILEIMANYNNRNNKNNNNSDNTKMQSISDNQNDSGFLGVSPTQSPSQSLRRAHSAANLTTNQHQSDNSSNQPSSSSLKITPHRPPYQKSSKNTLSSLYNNKPLSINQQQKHLSSGNLDQSTGMWPRPGTEVPHQWRRRSSSQPFVPVDNTSMRPPKDPRRMMNQTSALSPPATTSPIQNYKTIKNTARSKSPLKNSINIQTPSSTPSALQPSPVTLPSDKAIHIPSTEDSLADMNDSLIDGSDSSSYMAESLSSVSRTDSSLNDLQSRPASITYAPAPGLPSDIQLQPQDTNPGALLEEYFILSPGSLASTPVTSHYNFTDSSSYPREQHRASIQYTQGFTRNGTQGLRQYHPRANSTDMLSVISTAQSSVLDPDEDIMQMMQAMEIRYQQQLAQRQSLEQHYTYAELPPIPSSSQPRTTTTTPDERNERCTTIYYEDDSDDDNGDDEVDTHGMYDSDDSDDDDGNKSTNKSDANEQNTNQLPTNSPPPIAVSPLPPLPHEQDEKKGQDQEVLEENPEPVCLCPKHGVIVPRR
ncbi:uncharacterized protein BX664DRAFT_388239 [Halteromyces radiatus]|uniref:uncharacterized protein n=1 Tax=Halteromyces radiatus TaxID=101107 RepID=UPI0022211507|nr:uncharacterized protein BX664DRAFT_388239 [Halteromyces radiatus]KAI8083144.1 hypothetical protein BX664DRAFT_388239 [Halteromyces radiatus]